MDKELIFISYARADSDFALKLAQALRMRGAKLWLDQLDIKPGSRWDVSIEKALKNSETLLVILTPESVSSNNVMDEVSYALEEGKKILPVLHILCDRPLRLRRYQFADFTKGFQKGIESLTTTFGLEKGEPVSFSEEVLKTQQNLKDVSINEPKKGTTSKDEKETKIKPIPIKDKNWLKKDKVDEQIISNKTTDVVKRKTYGKFILYLILFIIVIILGVWGISIINKKDGRIEKPIANEFMESETGLKYKFHYRSNNNTSPKEDDYLDLIMVYGNEDTVLFDSRILPDSQKFNIPMIASVFYGDIYEGFSMMHKGDSATFRLVADSVWIKLFKMENTPPGMESVEYIDFNVKLINILSQAEVEHRKNEVLNRTKKEELLQRKIFIKENYPNASKTKSGLYIEIFKKVHKGQKPKTGETVHVHYIGRLLDGTQFDSSYDRGVPFEFPLGQGRVIKGWDEGIAMMKVGEKAVLVIPSDLAYGSQGSGKITPYSSVVFEVELMSITD